MRFTSSSFSPPAAGVLHRKGACGTPATTGGECVESRKQERSGKFKVSKPTDVHEREAGQIANRMSAARRYPATRDTAPPIQPLSGQAAGGETAPATGQLLKMKAAGVRFWRSGEFPPPFNDDYAPSKTKRGEMARYEYRYRVIQWGLKGGVDEIRHELAHAWDHVRGGKVARLDRYKGARLRKAILAPATFSSESGEKRVTIGTDTKVALSVQDAFDRFMKRPAQSYWSFANARTDPEHVTSNVKEFYAEGYSVFHGDSEEAQAALLCDAPELFQLLEKEAKAAKLVTPDRGKLIENNTSNNRKCASAEP